jgi:hypothetical protein
VLLAGQVVLGFERTPVERVTRRWVVVADGAPDAAEATVRARRDEDLLVSVEPTGQNPAA